MDFKIRICNYRSIPFEKPLEVEIRKGITFILGINNIGKSNLLKFFYEFRSILSSTYTNGMRMQSGLGASYDQIANRANISLGILFEIEFPDQIIHFNVTPITNQYSSNAVNLEVRIESRGNDSQIVNLAHKIGNVFYIGSFRSSINNSNGAHFDVSIGQNFINQWIDWADGNDVLKRQRIKVLKQELKDLFAFNDFNLRVNSERNNLLVTADGEDFLLSDMGSGISHFIIVLANVLIRQPSLILIDEPETNLHPKLQETFTRALAAKASFGFIATSHSVGLARSVADHIYSLTKHNNSLRLEPYGSHFKPTISQSINEMGYSQFVETGGNNILLVEGRTDVKVFREILRKYSIENKFIILSFGGSQFVIKDKTKIIEELSEVNRLNAKSVNVIFDSEQLSPNEKLKGTFQVFYDVCTELKFNVFATDRHSTENYFTQAAITKVLGNGHSSIGPHIKFENTWDKNDNWLIVNEMSKTDFAGTELDKFIREILIPLAAY